MNAVDKAEALASIRQDLGGLGLGLVLGAVACYFVRPKTKATNALQMAQRWLAWGLLGSVSSGISFWMRNYDRGGILGAAITILFFSGLAWGLGYVWGRINFATASSQRQVSTTPTGLGAKSLSSLAFMGFIGAVILALVVVSGIKDGWNTTKPKNWWEEPGAVERVHKKLGIAPAPNVSLDELAEQGNPYAQQTLGLAYLRGDNGKQLDAPKGFAWIRRAAEQNHLEAQTLLGALYLQDHFMPKDRAEAIMWLTKAAEAGHTQAQVVLGQEYLKGGSTEMSINRGRAAFSLEAATEGDNLAAKWLTKAAEKGHLGAQLEVGILYQEGRGVEKSSEEGLTWLSKAASAGDTEAKKLVGLAYFKGEGVTKNHQKAAKVLHEAAAQGSTGAQYMLGTIYAQGLGVVKDESAALAWLYLTKAKVGAEQEGIHREIAEEIARLEERLGVEQTLRAQELAKTLVPEKTTTAASN